MIVLRSPELLVRIDPRHGGEILDLVHLPTGRQLLGRPPFGSTEPVAGDLDEATWTSAYRGGWQLLAPNAGNACVVEGERHGFHGRASNDPWHPVAVTETSTILSWSGHGLELERRVVLDGATLAVSVRAGAAERRVPLVLAEHVALGLELFEPEVAIELPPAPAYELSERDGPAAPREDPPCWPEVRLLDGSAERADRWPLARARSRLLAVADLPEGRATIRNDARGIGLELTWDSEWLRHVWLWHEVRTYGGRWRGLTELLAVEPASVPHSLGLAAAIERGEARWLEPGETCGYRLSARPFTFDVVGQT